MKTIHIPSLSEEEKRSPKGKYHSFCKNVSMALGGWQRANEPGDPHPFDVQIRRLPPGASVCPYHAHTGQWELFIILSGEAAVRRNGEIHSVTAGDAFMQPPGTAHQITNSSATEDLSFYVIADHPTVDVCHYPDSNKYGTRPLGKFFRMQEVDYFDGEE
jgi:uncharacterized cupin superfamily protein